MAWERSALPYASVYLDTSRDRQNAPREIELRWRALRAELADAGADDAPMGRAASRGRR